VDELSAIARSLDLDDHAHSGDDQYGMATDHPIAVGGHDHKRRSDFTAGIFPIAEPCRGTATVMIARSVDPAMETRFEETQKAS